MIKQLLALAWKEWREHRWVIGFSLVTFIGLPLISGLLGRRYAHRFDFVASPWVLIFGGLLAIVVSTDAVCRDIEVPLSHFWRSRAVGTTQWMLVKYVIGLGLVLACCVVPLVIEQWQHQGDPGKTHFAAVILAWFPFIWAVQFGFGFASGALIGRPGAATMVALALTMLAYLLPLSLPPLHAFNITEALFQFSATAGVHPGSMRQVPWAPWPVPFSPRQQLPILIAAILLSAGGLILAILAVGREWRIRSAQRMAYWSIGLVFLLAIASASFQLGTNLPILQTVDPGPSRFIYSIISDGRHGVVAEASAGGHWGIRTLDLSNGEVRLGPAINVAGGPSSRNNRVWLSQRPDFYFMLNTEWSSSHADVAELTLGIANLGVSPKPVVRTVRLATISNVTHTPPPSLQAVGDRLYAMWWKDDQTPQAVTIEVDDPTHPRILPCDPHTPDFLAFANPPSRVLGFEEVPAQGVSAVDREKAAVPSGGLAALCPPDVLGIDGSAYGHRFTVFKLKSFGPPTGVLAMRPKGLRPQPVYEFRQIGQYEPTMLEDLIRGFVEQVVAGRGSTVYVNERTNHGDPLWRTTVFDVSNPAHPRIVGYFAAPERGPITICPLPDGRALAGGQKLYLLGPPPHRSE